MSLLPSYLSVCHQRINPCLSSNLVQTSNIKTVVLNDLRWIYCRRFEHVWMWYQRSMFKSQTASTRQQFQMPRCYTPTIKYHIIINFSILRCIVSAIYSRWEDILFSCYCFRGRVLIKICLRISFHDWTDLQLASKFVGRGMHFEVSRSWTGLPWRSIPSGIFLLHIEF